jgi:hypothetical protein
LALPFLLLVLLELALVLASLAGAAVHIVVPVMWVLALLEVEDLGNIAVENRIGVVADLVGKGLALVLREVDRPQ